MTFYLTPTLIPAEDYRRELLLIDQTQKSKASHSHALHRELSAALQELQSLVSEGRDTIARHVRRQEDLIGAHLHALRGQLGDCRERARAEVGRGLELTFESLELSL